MPGREEHRQVFFPAWVAGTVQRGLTESCSTFTPARIKGGPRSGGMPLRGTDSHTRGGKTSRNDPYIRTIVLFCQGVRTRRLPIERRNDRMTA